MNINKWWVAGGIAVAAIGYAVYSGKVHAADLGGSCCGDLEERVAEMEATTARKANRKVSLTIYGQVSRAVLWHKEDGEAGTNRGFELGDNFNSPSRFGFRGEAKISPDMKAGFVIELGVAEPGTQVVNGTIIRNFDNQPSVLYSFDGETASSGLSIRHNYAYVETKLGKVSLGWTGTAADGIVEINLGNTYVGALTPLGLGNLFDGGRTNVVRYDSPTLAGFTVAASVNDAEAWDVALRYAGELGSFRLAAGAAYSDLGGDVQRISGSVSAMEMTTGLFLTGNYGEFSLPGAGALKPTGYHAVGGIERKWMAFGASTLFGEYARIKDLLALDDGAKMIGLGITQKIDAAAMDLFVSYRRFDPTEASSSSFDTIMAGARIAF